MFYKIKLLTGYCLSLALGIVFLLFSCQPKDPDVMQNLRGMWKMHIFEYQDSTGQWQEYPWNAGGTGYLIYDGKGGMAAHFTPKDYAQQTVDLETPTDSLTREVLENQHDLFSANYIYMGKARILPGDSIVEHTRISHTYPKDWGVVVQRRFDFKADTLLLYPVEGKVPRRLKWIRVD